MTYRGRTGNSLVPAACRPSGIQILNIAKYFSDIDPIVNEWHTSSVYEHGFNAITMSAASPQIDLTYVLFTPLCMSGKPRDDGTRNHQGTDGKPKSKISMRT